MNDRTGNEAIVDLLRAGVLDAELAALLWLLVEERVPVVVAGGSIAAAAEVRDALLALLSTDARPLRLAGEDEEFVWLPEATELGWRRERPSATDGRGSERKGPGPERASSATDVLVADLDGGTPGGTWGPRARIAIRALALGYGMLATTAGERLEDVLGTLKTPPVSADDDELSRLGVVLVQGADDVPVDGGVVDDGAVDVRLRQRHRIVAAHYIRPVARDEHGHVQRMPPAVLATWNPASDRFDHFAWGVTTELAIRVGRSPIELEREQARRARDLAALAASPS